MVLLDPPFMQSVICPICHYIEAGSDELIQQMHGTGFLIDNDGIFITARHVIESAFAGAQATKGKVAIFPMQRANGKTTSLTVPILNYEFAPTPFDVAILQTNYRSNTFFRFQKNRLVEVWQDVATMGYPIAATHKGIDQYEVQQRAHKGYIQRIIPSGRLRIGAHPDVFELSFAITNGLSGAPLFIHAATYEIVIGVCVGSHSSRIVNYEETVQVKNNSETLKEQVIRLEEFGIAHDVRPLFDWKPSLLGGRTFFELSGQLTEKS